MESQEFLVECEAYPWSREYFEILKESYEISTLEKYIENMQYVSDLQLDFYEGTIPFGDDYFQDFGYSYTEAKKVLKNKKKGLLARLLDKFMKIVRKFSSVSQSLVDKNMDFYQKAKNFDPHRMDQEWFSHVWTKKEILKIAKEHNLDLKKYAKMVILINKGETAPDIHFDRSVDENTRRAFTNFTLLGFKYGCKIVLSSVIDDDQKKPAHPSPYQMQGGGNLAATMVSTTGAVATAAVLAYGLSKISGLVMTTTQVGQTVSKFIDDFKNGDAGQAIENINEMRKNLEKTAATYDPSNPKDADVCKRACKKLEDDISNYITAISNQLQLQAERIDATFASKDAEYNYIQQQKQAVANTVEDLKGFGKTAVDVASGKRSMRDAVDAGKRVGTGIKSGYQANVNAKQEYDTARASRLQAEDREAVSGAELNRLTIDTQKAMAALSSVTVEAHKIENSASNLAANSARVIGNMTREVQSIGLDVVLNGGAANPRLSDGDEPVTALGDGSDATDIGSEVIEVPNDSGDTSSPVSSTNTAQNTASEAPSKPKRTNYNPQSVVKRTKKGSQKKGSNLLRHEIRNVLGMNAGTKSGKPKTSKSSSSSKKGGK